MSSTYQKQKRCFHCGRGILSIDTLVEIDGKIENYCNPCGDLAMVDKLHYFVNPYNSLLRKEFQEFKLTIYDIEKHTENNINSHLPFFNPCPNCKSINTGNVGTCESMGMTQDTICLSCDTRFWGKGMNFLQREYLKWLIQINKLEVEKN